MIMMLASGDRPGDISRCERLRVGAYLLKPIKPGKKDLEQGDPLYPPDIPEGTHILIARETQSGPLQAVLALRSVADRIAATNAGEITIYFIKNFTMEDGTTDDKDIMGFASQEMVQELDYLMGADGHYVKDEHGDFIPARYFHINDYPPEQRNCIFLSAGLGSEHLGSTLAHEIGHFVFGPIMAHTDEILNLMAKARGPENTLLAKRFTATQAALVRRASSPYLHRVGGTQ